MKHIFLSLFIVTLSACNNVGININEEDDVYIITYEYNVDREVVDEPMR